MNRMFEIIYLLLGKEQVTANELAEHFEVSKRTIYRDIEKLTMSGIPIYTNQGKGGGIRLVEKFTLNKSMLNEHEQNEILSSLQGLGAITDQQQNQTLQKLSSFFDKNLTNWIEVDFSSWNNNSENQFALLKQSILERRIITFTYYNTYGEQMRRRVEPVQLWFKHGAWYLKAYCLHKKGSRTFKLTRMKELQVSTELFLDRQLEFVKPPDQNRCQNQQDQTFVIHISAAMTYRIYDEFDEKSITRQEDGSFLVTMVCPEDDWLYGFILSYGEHAKLISPMTTQQRIKEKTSRIMKLY